MGSPNDEPKRGSYERQHDVEIKPFAIGKYTVTFEEYDHFTEATGQNRPDDEGWGRGRQPVINVSWPDAIAYAEWLSQQTDLTYRLPTEAEWEYACRAGTTTAYHFGASIKEDQANYKHGFLGLASKKTLKVGQYPANAWGLHDMHGNVWELIDSEYDVDYRGAELRGISDPNSDSSRVLRGGSWDLEPSRLRSAAREWVGLRFRGNNCGFRVVRTLIN
ncbi:MAG: formylglycine-generating enzyme family protein [Candidatus Competibacter sp.]|nr:formylglycine-generating enzyme family protein [Candidatus Competibacter sp.]